MSKLHEQALLFLAKAREDEILLEEVRQSPRVSDAVFGFHAQQAAEKLLKALLSELGVAFPRTQDLRFFIELLGQAGRPVPPELAELDRLTPFATLYRYEHLAAPVALDRTEVCQWICRLREHAKQEIEGRKTSP